MLTTGIGEQGGREPKRDHRDASAGSRGEASYPQKGQAAGSPLAEEPQRTIHPYFELPPLHGHIRDSLRPCLATAIDCTFPGICQALGVIHRIAAITGDGKHLDLVSANQTR